MRYKVTFIRHGAPDELTFHCQEDADMFADWLYPAGVGIHPEIAEVGAEPSPQADA